MSIDQSRDDDVLFEVDHMYFLLPNVCHRRESKNLGIRSDHMDYVVDGMNNAFDDEFLVFVDGDDGAIKIHRPITWWSMFSHDGVRKNLVQWYGEEIGWKFRTKDGVGTFVHPILGRHTAW